MVATFEVETGTGSATANAYISLADADQWNDNEGTADAAWGATDVDLTQAQKEQAIRSATSYLDAVYGKRWKGTKILYTQALDFPKDDVLSQDGFYYLSNEVPQKLKDACAYMARIAAGSGTPVTLLVDIEAADSGSVRMLKKRFEGVAEKTTEYFAPPDQQKVYPRVEGLLHDLLRPRSRIMEISG